MPYVDGCDLGRIIHDRKAHAAGRTGKPRHVWSALADQEYLEKMLPVLDQLVDAVALLHEDRTRFPPGSVEFDSALLMRGIEHEWHGQEPLRAGAEC